MNTDNSVLKLLRRLPSDICQEALRVVTLLHGHLAQSQAAREIVASFEAGGEEGARALLVEMAKGEAGRLSGQRKAFHEGQRKLRERSTSKKKRLAPR